MFFAIFCSLLLLGCAVPRTRWTDLRDKGYKYDQYLEEFSKSYDDPVEHSLRETLFKEEMNTILVHNAGSSTWKMGVNRFTDMTEDEVKSFKGRIWKGANLQSINLQSESPAWNGAEGTLMPLGELPTSVDWRDRQPSVVSAVKDQGGAGCGSCYSYGAASVLESAVAIATGTLLELSAQQIIDCAPNQQQCGGTGGCDGSTPELAYAYTQNGIATTSAYPETNNEPEGGGCMDSVAALAAANTGFVAVPTNNYLALMNAVATVGPISVNVATGGGGSLMNYESGVYSDECGTTVDHVVVVMGYGSQDGQDYYLLRNSWGGAWGDEGYIKIARHDDDDQEANCADDLDPGSGTACLPYPETQRVCGLCGILSDASFPTGAHILSGYAPNSDAPPADVANSDAPPTQSALEAIEGATRPLVAL